MNSRIKDKNGNNEYKQFTNIDSFILLSEKRKNLLLLLQDGAKTLDEIKGFLRVTSSGIIPQIRKMEEKGLIYQKNKNYYLTEIGLIIAKSFDKFYRTVKILEKNWKFWHNHKVSGIPDEFLLRIYELGSYIIFESDKTDIFKPHREYINNLLKAKWVRGVSPILHPEYPKTILTLARRGTDISIIMSEEVFRKIKEEHLTELKEGLSYENMRLFVCKKRIEVAFTVTDFFLSLRLFLKDDTYDFYRNIISYDKSALKWGRDLFSYFEKYSNIIRNIKKL
jgi:predicted transcriptional regulator